MRGLLERSFASLGGGGSGWVIRAALNWRALLGYYDGSERHSSRPSERAERAQLRAPFKPSESCIVCCPGAPTWNQLTVTSKRGDERKTVFKLKIHILRKEAI